MKLPRSPSELTERAGAKPRPDASILSHFQAIPDFRREHGRPHLLIDILVIAACATFADCDTFVEMAEYGVDNEACLRTFLELPEGVPSHDTFRRVFLHLAPASFQRACVSWLRATAAKPRSQQQVLAAAPTDSPAGPPTTRPVAQVAGTAAGGPLAPPTASAAEAAMLPGPTANPLAYDRATAPTPTRPAADRLASQPSGATTHPPALADAPSPHPAPTPDAGSAPAPLVAQPAPATASLSAQAAMAQPVASPTTKPEGQRRHLAVDGKTSRGSVDKAADRPALHLVSVWASEERLTLAQVAVEAKSNEITAIPEVLKLVDLSGAVVSIDAMGTQIAIVAEIREGGGDYVLAVKENQPHLYEDVVASFVSYFDRLDGKADSNEWVVTSKGQHGRKEKRTYVVINEVSGIRDREKWRDVKRLIMVHRECAKSDGTWEEDSRYFIGSAACGVQSYAKWVRDHWGIENQLHWVLDVVFHEDASRTRKDHGTENLAMLRRLAVSVLGNDKVSKRSIKGRRKKAARDTNYLAQVLLGLADLDTPLEVQKTAPPA